MKKKTWTYPQYVKVPKEGKIVLNVMTQLYQIGVYVCTENPRGREQRNLTPAQTIKYMKSFLAENLKDGYTSEFGISIHVIKDEDGFYKRVEI